MSIEQIRLVFFAIVGVMAAFFLFRRKVFSVPSPLLRIFLYVVGGVAGVAAGLSLSLVVKEFLSTEFQQARRVKIFSLRDASQVEGKFVLGNGWIGNMEYYTYYYNAGPGMKKDRVPVKNTYILEGEYQPELVVYERRYLNPTHQYFVGPVGQTDVNNQDLRRYEFYVPKGTVVQQFSLK